MCFRSCDLLVQYDTRLVALGLRETMGRDRACNFSNISLLKNSKNTWGCNPANGQLATGKLVVSPS